MILLIFALLPEAQPFLQRLKLKKHSFGNRLEIYLNDGYAVLITGIGKVPAAVRTARALQLLELADVEQVVNLGICGCGEVTTPVGKCFLINNIREMATGRAFFPDMLEKHSFTEGTLITVDQPQKGGPEESLFPVLYDMEAAGIFQAASAFISVDRLHFLKVVSDHLDGGLLGKGAIEELLESVADEVLKFVCELPIAGPIQVINQEEHTALENLQLTLRLTQTQSVQVRDLAMAFLLSGGVELIEKLFAVTNNLPKTQTKASRNAALKQLHHVLGA
jgi:nucleoside phosphorylase